MLVYQCDQCGRTAPPPAELLLPRGWQQFVDGDLCPACIRADRQQGLQEVIDLVSAFTGARAAKRVPKSRPRPPLKRKKLYGPIIDAE